MFEIITEEYSISQIKVYLIIPLIMPPECLKWNLDGLIKDLTISHIITIDVFFRYKYVKHVKLKVMQILIFIDVWIYWKYFVTCQLGLYLENYEEDIGKLPSLVLFHSQKKCHRRKW